MEELNKKIAEWCGFYSKVVTNKSADFNGIYMDKDGMFKKMPDTYKRTLWHDPEITPDSGCRDYWYAANGLPDFTTSLDACFKYVVPKLRYADIQFSDQYSDVIPQFSATVSCQFADNHTWADNNPALAFCKAVEKLIDG